MVSSAEIAVIEHALKLFHDDENGCHICSDFFDLGLSLRAEGTESAPFFRGVTQDVWNIATLVARLEWMRALTVNGHLGKETWRSFSSLDIENFFVQVRSVMDHVTEILQVNLSKGKQLPDSFRKLRGSLDKYRQRLPLDIVKLIEATSWFDHMRSVRDTLVHQGGYSLVFDKPQDGILFQVYGKDLNGRVFHPALMFNKNVVHFERYAGLTTANLLAFLDSLGLALLSTTEAELKVGPARSYCAGFPLLKIWLIELLYILRNRSE